MLTSASVCVSIVIRGQNPSPNPGDFGPDPANIPAPTAPTAPPAGVPMLAFHFGVRPLPPLGQKFGNVAAVAFTPEGHLLVFNRNAQIEMVEYDATGSKVLRVFNPNIAINPHALRIDRSGSIWATDAYWKVLWKLSSKGEVLMMLGKRGENGAWNDAAWNGMFNQPLDIAFDQDDNFYVVQGHGGTSPPEDCSFCTTGGRAATAGPPRRRRSSARGARLGSAAHEIRQERAFGREREPGTSNGTVCHDSHHRDVPNGRAVGGRSKREEADRVR